MKSTKNRSIKWTHKGGKVVYYPILEARQPLTFTVTDKDVVKAATLKGYADPNQCVAACAMRRQFTDGIFQRDTVYTLQVHGGEVYAVRYRFGSSLRRAIQQFDDGGIFPVGNHKLLPPTASQTLEAKAQRSRMDPLTNRTVRAHVKFTARGKVTPMS